MRNVIGVPPGRRGRKDVFLFAEITRPTGLNRYTELLYCVISAASGVNRRAQTV